MKYDWQKDAESQVRGKVNKLNESLDRNKPYAVLGVVIENEDTGEAMFMPVNKKDEYVLLSDILLDAVSDLEALYHTSVSARRLQ
jgi:hypothetical protein